MRILIGDEWRDGYLDEHRAGCDLRISARAFITLQSLDDLYFVRDRSLRRVWNYVREVGILWVARKILSRRREASRNEKFLSIGLGVVDEAPVGGAYRAGDAVAFLATCHPRAVERLVVPPELVVRLEGEPTRSLPAESIALAQGRASLEGLAEEVGGWSPHAGRTLDAGLLSPRLKRAVAALREENWTVARRLPLPSRSAVQEREGSPAPAARPTAVLFGYGNYGKAIVLNNVRHRVSVAAIHELDPTLVPPDRDRGVTWDTAPLPRDDERYDVYLIASYHHTHVPLALHALKQGAVAVVEKPIATEVSQLDALLATLNATNGRFYAGFHKRYSALNALASRDLKIRPGDPVHYHAIVFEEPLPAHHWYRWPNSCSRIVSNGCHWLDHFLFLNGWSDPVGLDVGRGGPGGEIANVSVRLANGAFFSLLLTDAGSGRVGVRDYIELRAGGVTVTIDNGARYVAEDGSRVLRRARINKMTSYQNMYRTIANRIAGGEAGDTPRSIGLSTKLVLDVEAAYQAAAR